MIALVPILTQKAAAAAAAAAAGALVLCLGAPAIRKVDAELTK
jgi:hypothetical protein